MPPPVSSSRYKAAVREQRVRAITACEYCRQKKLKCSNDRPICQQCQARGKDCAYVETLKLPRPSRARISRLEEENRYLRDSLAKFEQGLNPQRGVDKTAESQTSAEASSESLESMSVHAPELLDPPLPSQVDTVAQSHGPTSAVTDETSSNLDMMAKESSHHVDSEELEALQNALFANSARLSQMERMNFNSGRFDFDGVDSRVAMRLLSLYWDRQLDVGAVVYRPTFMRDMACNGPYFSKLLLNAIYFTASKYCFHEEVFDDRTEALTAGRRFRRRAMELIGNHITKSEIPTAQALLLLSHALFNWCDEKSLSWLYSGMAINMIIDLGLDTGHNTDPRVGKLAPEDIEARQRLFWGAYSIDKFLSLYQGRCIRLRDADRGLYPRFLDEFEEYETLQVSSYAQVNEISDLPAHNISILKGYCCLSIIMSGIIDTLYTKQSTIKEPKFLLETSSSLYYQLQSWLKSIPSVLTDKLSHMSRGVSSPHILSLRALYHTLEILLHRPFVSDGHLRGLSSAAPLAFNICVSAASSIDQILSCYREVFSTRLEPYTLSYATYVSATIHARVAAQSPPGSQAHTSLQMCVSTLKEHQETSLGPKKALGVILNLMRRVGIDEKVKSITKNPGIITTDRCANISETCGSMYGGSSTRTQGYADSVPNSSQSFLSNEVPLIPSESSEYDMDCVFQTFNIAHVVPPVQFSPPQFDAEKDWEASIPDPLSESFLLDPLYGLENITGV